MFTENQQLEATRKFVMDALAYRLHELFPDLNDVELTTLVNRAHNEMLTHPTDHDRLNPKDYSETDLALIRTCQDDIGAAVVGLGGDIMEAGAIHRIMWTGDDDTEEDTSEEDAAQDAEETALAESWMDENGLLTGAVDYIRQNLKPGQDKIIWQTMKPEANWGDMSSRRQIGLFHEVRGKGANKRSLYTVTYQDGDLLHYITITQFEATACVIEGQTPYKVWRPFITTQGVKYHLVRQVVVQRFDVPEAPAFLNYLLVKAEKLLYKALDDREEFDDGDVQDMFMEIALGERRLPNFNSQPTEPQHVLWLTDFEGLLQSFTSETAADELRHQVSEAAKRFHDMTSTVTYHYALDEVVFEDDADDELDLIDGSLSSGEISLF